MTKFLHWRKMTWTFLVWSAVAWPLVCGAGAALTGVVWFAGMIGLGLLWLATQPLFQQGRGHRGMFFWPHRGQWRVANFHRTHVAAEPRHDASVLSVEATASGR